MRHKLLATIAALAVAAALAFFASGPAVATEPGKAPPPTTTPPPTLRPIGKNLDDIRDGRGPAVVTGDDEGEPLAPDDDDEEEEEPIVPEDSDDDDDEPIVPEDDDGNDEDEGDDDDDSDDETDDGAGEEEEDDDVPDADPLIKKLQELETKKEKIEKKIADLTKGFRDSEGGKDADKKIDELDAQKKNDLKKIEDTVKKMRAEAEAQFKIDEPGAPVACCVDSKLYDESRDFERDEKGNVYRAHDKAVDEILRSELKNNDPAALKKYEGLKTDLNGVKTEKEAVNKALTFDSNAGNAPRVQP